MKKMLKKIELSKIEITDLLFKAYVDKVTEKIIPHQWKILNNQLPDAEPTWCIENFRIAAGEKEGTRKGVVFQDTDVYKWLEALAYSLAGNRGKEYESLADEVIDLIGRAQEEDGYLNTYFTVNAPDRKWKNLLEGHELYTAGHMIESAVAYYLATGKDKLLTIAKKNADLICRIFGTEEGQIPGYPGHQEIEVALVKLYRVTGEAKYLKQADYFIRERGKQPNYFEKEISLRGEPEFFPEFSNYDLEYSQADIEPVKQQEAEGHAVRAMYMCAAMADLAGEYEDEEMLTACKKIWDSAVNRRMYITGGIGSSGFRERFTTDYDLPNATNYSETCASIGLMMFGQRMNAITGDASYYDVVERALYNNVLAGINMEGDRYFYVNPLEVVPEFCTEHTYMEHVKPVRQKWFSVACCPTNVARTLASLGQYIYAEDGEALYIQQYISSIVRKEFAKAKVELEMVSTLLQNGKVKLTIKSEGENIVKLRIPGYSGKWKVSVNEEMISPEIASEYMEIPLKDGESKVLIDFDIKAKWVGANERVSADTGKAALQKGPLVYCLEEIDNGKKLSQIYVSEETVIEETSPEPVFAGEIPTLTYQGIRIHNNWQKQDSLYENYRMTKEEVKIRAVPYCLWNNRGQGEMEVWQKVRV